MAKGPRAERRRAKKRKERERRLAHERHQRRSGPVPIEDLPEEPPMPPRYFMERALRGTGQGSNGTASESLDARQRRIDALIERAARDPEALDVDERRLAAQELAFRAMEARSLPQGLMAVEKAIALDPDCVDALALLARLVENPEARVEALRRAVAAGELRLGGPDFLDAQRGHFWGLVETRPYMRARHSLAMELHGLGRHAEAAEHYGALLELNPNDNQGVGDALVALHLELGDLAAARALLARLPDDASPVHAWARILERFLAGDRRAAARGVSLAADDNPNVRGALAGRTRPQQRDDGYYKPGTESEAALVVDVLGQAWNAYPDAVQWLRDGAPTSTAEERRAAVASYRKPLAELLGWGEPELQNKASAQAAADLGRDDVPELIRMASDIALSEMEGDSPQVWAPIHAIRALAHLRPPEAVAPLLGLLREGLDDQWLLDELLVTLTRIGSPGLADLIRLVDEDGAPLLARLVAAEALNGIRADEPDTRAEVVAAQARTLRNYLENPFDLNAVLVLNLALAGATEHRDLMREAFDSPFVSKSRIRSWEQIEAALELA